MKGVDSYQFTFFEPQPEPEPQPKFKDVKIQKQITNDCHAIYYQLQDFILNDTNIKIEFIRKNKPTKTLIDLPIVLYDNILKQFFEKHNANIIFLNLYQNLKLDKDNYILITFSTTVLEDKNPELTTWLENTLLTSSKDSFEIQKNKVNQDFNDTSNFTHFYHHDFTTIKTIELKIDLKSINTFTKRTCLLYADYFLDKGTNVINLLENQLIKINLNDVLTTNYYYLIKN